MLIKKAQDIGYRGENKYIWHACIDCGKERWVPLTKGQPKNLRCVSCAVKQRGYFPHHWKGGQFQAAVGYVYILKPEHPKANHLGYVKRAILVLEAKLSRCLLSNAVAHHINGIKNDDRPESLEEVILTEHSRNHMLETWRQRKARRL